MPKEVKVLLSFMLCAVFTRLVAANWTIFVYMAADNGLYNSAIADLIEMQKGLNSTGSKPKIIVYIDHISNQAGGAVQYLQMLPSSGNTLQSQVLASYSDENSGSGETLTRFLNWAYQRHASANNMLILWSHSSGWQDTGISRWIANDWTARDAIGVSSGELRQAFVAHNKKYNIIMLDACNTGSIEFIAELNGFADYIIATPDEVPLTGSPWIQILANWDDSHSPAQLTEAIIDHTMDAYYFGGVYNPYGYAIAPVSLSAFDMSHYRELFEAIKDFADTYADPSYATHFTNIKNNTPDYNNGYDIDLVYFINNSSLLTPHSSLQTSLNKFIHYNQTLNSLHNKTISIWFPDEFDRFFAFYQQHYHSLQFEKSGWARFLNYMWGADTRAPDPPSNVNYVVNLETIYIDWEAPIDPCPLEYGIRFSVFGSRETAYPKYPNTEYQTPNTEISIRIPQDIHNGYFTITTIDEAGNRSDSDTTYYFAKPQISQNKFYIAPNPVRDNHFTIYYYLSQPTDTVNFTIYNIAGQLVYEKTEYSKSLGEGENISVSGLQTGVYIAIMRTNNGTVRNKFSVIR